MPLRAMRSPTVVSAALVERAIQKNAQPAARAIVRFQENRLANMLRHPGSVTKAYAAHQQADVRQRRMASAVRRSEPEHQAQVLHCGAARAFPEVVQARYQNGVTICLIGKHAQFQRIGVGERQRIKFAVVRRR